MTARRFAQVDVFTDVALGGNPLAVVLDSDGLDAERMQAIARWTNLSETVFVSASARADYRVRIFSPRNELPFAGHPTIGTAHAARRHGLVDPARESLVQECGAGLVPLRADASGVIRARVPRPKRADAHVSADDLSAAFGGAELHDPFAVDVGVVWIVARVSPATLAALRPDFPRLAALSTATRATGATVYAVAERARGGAPGPAVEVRSFAPADGIPEDPVCGSGNASVAAHARLTGQLATIGSSYLASQGRFVGRDGRIAVTLEGDDVWIGGRSVTVVSGTIDVG